jgi:hypothetical protein
MGKVVHRRAPTVVWLLALLSLALGVIAPGGPGDRAQNKAGATPVDLELVLAVDVSLSMDYEEQRLQRDGYVSALRDPAIEKAILTGPRGRIAVTYIEWAGAAVQRTVLDWTLLDSPESIEAFAERLAAVPITRARMTSISASLEYSARSIDTSPFIGDRRVIDVSGDGPNNSGPLVKEARAAVLAKGIVINGLPIIVRPSNIGGFFDIRALDVYYAECVIGGPGSFMIPVRDRTEFATAIRKKLILEISGLEAPAPIVPVQLLQDQSTDCTIGEKLWQEYMRGRTLE